MNVKDHSRDVNKHAHGMVIIYFVYTINYILQKKKKNLKNQKRVSKEEEGKKIKNNNV